MGSDAQSIAMLAWDTAMRTQFTGGTAGVAPHIVCAMVLVAVAALDGCDRAEDGRAAPSAAATPAPAPPTSSPAAGNAPQSYPEVIKPLVEAMQRMRILTEHPAAVEASEFHRQFREVKLRWEQAEIKLAAADRARKSWQHYVKAMELLRQAEQGLEQETALNVKADNPKPQPPADLDHLPEIQQRGNEVLDDLKNALILQSQLPRTMAAAGGYILLAESALRRQE
jgi:hypothetical protein